MIIYYIYHLPHFIHKDGSIGKIGVSEKPKIRTKNQGYADYEILEEYTCIYKVSDREIELQKQYGYPVDKQLYWKTRKMPTKEGNTKGGKTAVESGQLRLVSTKEASSKGGLTQSQITYTCPYCGNEGKSNVMLRHHFDKCKYKI